MRNRIYFAMLIFILVVIIAATSYSMFHVGKNEESYAVSVIVNNSNSDRWISLRQGLEQAAKDYNIDLSYVSTGELAGAEEEMALIRREIENGAEGIIVQMVSSEKLPQTASDSAMNTAVILLETDVETEGIYTYVGPNNRKLGKALADGIKKEFGETLGEKKLVILSGSQKQLSMQQRLRGFLDGLEDMAAERMEIIETIEALDLSGEDEQVDAIVTLGNDETEQVIDYLQREEIENIYFLYGIGCSEKAVYYLDKGIINMLVVPNEFNMGYQSMESMANRLRYHLADAENSFVDYLVIDRDNLYDVDNQKVLFPIVQ